MSHRATVTELQTLAPQVVQITVAFAGGDFAFQPGQWVNFRFPEGVSRAYTIASAPQRPEAVQLCVRVGPGKGGVAVQKLQAGAEVSIDGPYGDFLLPPADGAEAVAFLAGDTGIAPVRSIVLTMLATNDPRRAIVLYEPDHRHILYAGDFDPLARDGAIVHESGPIETLIARNRRRLAGAILMAAGFDPFLHRAHRALDENGIDPSAMITESFGAQP
jgi:ferredoxin-NADP reductase